MEFDKEYFESEDFRELLDSYETAATTGAYPFMDADDLIDIADYYNMIEEHDKAVNVVEHALQLYPNATLPNVFMAREALMTGNFELACQHADTIENKDDPDYHYLMAEIMIANGDIEGADEYLRNYGKTVSADEYIDFVKDCANLFIDYQVSDKAYEWMSRIKGNDRSTDFNELMARTLLGLGKFKESQILLNKLLDKDPFCKEYWNALANSQLMSEEYHDAITSSEYALAIDPKDTEALANKANGLANLSNFEEALKYYQRYIEIEPDNAYILFQSGACLVNLGRNEEALDVLLKALSLTPEDAEQLPILYQELAFCYNALKQFDKAMEMLDKTKDLDCDHVDVMVTRGHLQLGNGNVKAAQKSFIQAIADSESDPYVILRIAISLYDNAYIQACYDMFIKLFSVIWKNHPEFTEGYSFMALCCYELNKPDEFLKYLKLACEKDPLEVKNTLAFLFPEEMEVKEYYRYMKELINSKSVN